MMKLHDAKVELAQNQESYQKTLLLANQIKGLKHSYFNKIKIQKSLGRVLRQSTLRSANITKKITNSGILLTSESMNISALNLLMSKILNGTYNISNLKIKRLSNENASLRLEIKW
ncbi:hypothetical protein [Sulfurimonas sp.]